MWTLSYLEGTCATDRAEFINSSKHILTHTFTNGFLISSMSSASSSLFFSFGPTISDNYKGRKKHSIHLVSMEHEHHLSNPLTHNPIYPYIYIYG